MTDSKKHSPESTSLQWRPFDPTSPAELIEALDHALDYRGDVLLELRGYIKELPGPVIFGSGLDAEAGISHMRGRRFFGICRDVGSVSPSRPSSHLGFVLLR